MVGPAPRPRRRARGGRGPADPARPRLGPRSRAALLASLLVGAAAIAGACSDDAAGRPPPLTPPRDAGGEAPEASRDAGSPVVDAGRDAEDLGPLTLTVFPRVGDPTDDPTPPKGPGFVLAGGPDVDAAFVWAHDTITGSKTARGGDVVVLRASGGSGYDAYIDGLAPWRSVQTLLLPGAPTLADYAYAAKVVAAAEMVWFAGGDQAQYVRWKGSALMKAVAGVHARGGVVGGTSAGAMIQGAFTFDALNAISESVTSAVALADPFDPKISLTKRVIDYPPAAGLGDVLVDVHFQQRGRLGRLSAFLARALHDSMADRSPPRALGIGVDEGVAVLVDASRRATITRDAPTADAAFFVRTGPAARVVKGQTLHVVGATVTRLDALDQSFDLDAWCGTGPTYTVDVDGAASPPYAPTPPYSVSAPPGACP